MESTALETRATVRSRNSALASATLAKGQATATMARLVALTAVGMSTPLMIAVSDATECHPFG